MHLCKPACNTQCIPDKLTMDNGHQVTLLHSLVQSHAFQVEHSSGKEARPDCDDQQDHGVWDVACVDCKRQRHILQHGKTHVDTLWKLLCRAVNMLMGALCMCP